jgi:hypothetical protein
MANTGQRKDISESIVFFNYGERVEKLHVVGLLTLLLVFSLKRRRNGRKGSGFLLGVRVWLLNFLGTYL